MPLSPPRKLEPFRVQLRLDAQGPVEVELPVRCESIEAANTFGRLLTRHLGYAHSTATRAPSRGGMRGGRAAGRR